MSATGLPSIQPKFYPFYIGRRQDTRRPSSRSVNFAPYLPQVFHKLWQTTCYKPSPQGSHGLEFQTEPPPLSLVTVAQFHARLQPSYSLQSVVSRRNIQSSLVDQTKKHVALNLFRNGGSESSTSDGSATETAQGSRLGRTG